MAWPMNPIPPYPTGSRRDPHEIPNVFYNGHEYVIAHAPLDAAALVALHFGEDSPEATRGDELKLWDKLSDDEQIPLTMVGQYIVELNTPGSRIVNAPARDWVKAFGIGYLASTDDP